MKKGLIFITVAAAMLFSNTIQADTFGYGGVSVGLSKARNTQDDNEGQRAHFRSVDGAIATELGANGIVVLEAEIRRDTHTKDIIDGDDNERGYQVGAHYLHDIDGNKLGVFLAYANTPHNDDNEDYRTVFGGIEGIATVAPEAMVYGQLGYGDAHNDGSSSFGFSGGRFVRIGAAYTGIANTVLKVETEVAKTVSYEDEDEPGYLRMYSLSGETGVNADNTLAVTYGYSHGKYKAGGDPDTLQENMVNVGVRYYFGGTTSAKALKAGLIGLPSIVSRATSWVPALD
jgi:hypothetical protein